MAIKVQDTIGEIETRLTEAFLWSIERVAGAEAATEALEDLMREPEAWKIGDAAHEAIKKAIPSLSERGIRLDAFAQRLWLEALGVPKDTTGMGLIKAIGRSGALLAAGLALPQGREVEARIEESLRESSWSSLPPMLGIFAKIIDAAGAELERPMAESLANVLEENVKRMGPNTVAQGPAAFLMNDAMGEGARAIRSMAARKEARALNDVAENGRPRVPGKGGL